ncbi:MAG: hypothetical protein C4296_11110 [Gemmataceae bacterium]
MRVLAALARGDRDVLVRPFEKDGVTYRFDKDILYIPHRVIKKDNVDAFHAEIRKLKSGAGTPTVKAPDGVRVAFLSNNAYEFWTFARRGTEQAAQDFQVEVEFHMPARGTAEEQKQIIEDLIVKGIKGIAISPNAAEYQAQFLDQVVEKYKIPVITQDSDLPPGSKRICYIGTNNYEAGRAAGQLVREVLPEGGKIAIFVGKLDVQNAVDRRRGVLDALQD